MEDIDYNEEEQTCSEKVINENDENDPGSSPDESKNPVALLQVFLA